MTDRYGEPPAQVANLIAVARFRLLARAYGLTDVSVQGKHLRFSPLPLPDSKQLRLKRYHPDSVYKPANDQVSVPAPDDPPGRRRAAARPGAAGVVRPAAHGRARRGAVPGAGMIRFPGVGARTSRWA